MTIKPFIYHQMNTINNKYAIVIALALCLVGIDTFAQEKRSQSNKVTIEEASRVAVNFARIQNRSNASITEIRYDKIGDTICLYNVYLSDRQWILVSASKSTVPVLAYGSMSLDTIDVPEAYVDLLEWYKKEICSLLQLDVCLNEHMAQWNSLLDSVASPRYEPGWKLLSDVSGSELAWGQSYNNDGGCVPSYNQDCLDMNCTDCDKVPVGCAAVAMGQIMWYWQWPKASSYRTYHWMLMPRRLHNGDFVSGVLISKLLKDCGDACNTFYLLCAGSAATIGNIEDAMNGEFAYGSVKTHEKNTWEATPLAWEELIKSEIDNNRPVLYYGDNSIVTTGHYFIVDGYSAYDYYLFHLNFGHRGNYNNFFYLGNIHEGGDSYCHHQKAITGISPTYSENSITDVDYFDIVRNNREIATNIISLPHTGDSLIVEESVNYLLEAGNSITLKHGFLAKYGSEVSVRINAELQNNMEISVDNLPFELQLGQSLCLHTHNADSWEFIATDASGTYLYHSAGSITDDNPCVWDGTNANVINYCQIRLKNSYGRYTEYEYWVTAVPQNKQIISGNDPKEYADDTPSPQRRIDGIKIYPNPSHGWLTVTTESDNIVKIIVYDETGHCLLSETPACVNKHKIDISNLVQGVYILCVETSDGMLYSDKIIKQK